MSDQRKFNSVDEAVKALTGDLEVFHQFWILDKDHTPIPVTCMELAVWMETSGFSERVVKQEPFGPYTISTVFLGINHNFFFEGPPLLFETMVFNNAGVVDFGCERCATWEQAEAQHKQIVEIVRNHQSN